MGSKDSKAIVERPTKTTTTAAAKNAVILYNPNIQSVKSFFNNLSSTLLLFSLLFRLFLFFNENFVFIASQVVRGGKEISGENVNDI